MGLLRRRPRFGDPGLLPDDAVSTRMELLAGELSQAADELHDLVAEMKLRKEIEAQNAKRGATTGQVAQVQQENDHAAHVEVKRRGKLSIDIHTEPEEDPPNGAT